MQDKTTISARATDIVIEGARVNNLKDVTVSIPRNSLSVITGVSGSGKSSLAFDTLYAEGQRRYVESLSAYARQFLGRLQKPECDRILGLPPAVAIEQKVNTRNPRSTVGTSTEVYDYIRLLYGRIGRTISPVSGSEVKRHTVEDVLAAVAALGQGTRFAVAAPVTVPQGRDLATQLGVYGKGGYSRVLLDGTMTPIEEVPADTAPGRVMLLVDRMAVTDAKDEVSRLAESIETAFYEGRGAMDIVTWDTGGNACHHRFSKRFEADGITFPEPNEQMFNFNNPYGACPRCEGFGRVVDISPDLVVPDADLSVYDDAVACWRGERMGEWKRGFIHEVSRTGADFPVHRPYRDLTRAQRKMLWNGVGNSTGINGFFNWVDTQQQKIQYRVLRARYRGKTLCPVCGGSRLRPECDNVFVGGKTVSDLVTMSIDDLAQWFGALGLDGRRAAIADKILKEITSRLQFIRDVGLGYLTLDRMSNTLSGGESQRINLATSLGSSLVGSLYILDEPSIGLHPRDTQRLIGVLKRLRGLGNTVVVVEHDEEIMRAADYLVDVGPDAGTLGGKIVYAGAVDSVGSAPRESYTARYLSHDLTIPVPGRTRRSPSYIEVKGASEHNLKNIDVRFPLGVFTAVTGVSGSGKSTLVRDILYKALVRELEDAGDAPGKFKGLRGDVKRLQAVEFVDQNPIGRSTRSNPATYLKAYDEIRKLFSEQQLARQMGYTPGHFSFNSPGGRCEECKGEGRITIEMQFMSDITIECEECHGKRFQPDVLQVRYRGKSIYDVLEMTVDEAVDFFGRGQGLTEKKIVERLKPLQDVGLGYIGLGQSSSTLSGGENQRVKLAYFLSRENSGHTLFIFDEPTTGLHFQDIRKLLEAFNRLVDNGNTIIVIEHNMDVAKCADHIIDMGPDGGDDGGRVVAQGTPAQIAANPDSLTGQWLKPLLNPLK